MKLLLLANSQQKEEFCACLLDEAVQLSWVTEQEEATTEQSYDVCIDLQFENSPERKARLRQLNVSLIVVNAVIPTLTEIDEPFVRINGWNSFIRRPLAELACKDIHLKKIADEIFPLLGRQTSWVPDMIGMVTPRVVSAIINEACFSLEEKISTEAEIDVAMKLGTNYPYGPFEWGNIIGLKQVYSLLYELSTTQPRYQPSPFLQQKALA